MQLNKLIHLTKSKILHNKILVNLSSLTSLILRRYSQSDNNNTNKLLVEGPYKNLIFRSICPSDYDKVCDNLCTYYVYGDPLYKPLGIDDAFKKEFKDFVKIVLKEDMSFYAEDPATNQIAAIRLNFIQRKGENIFSHLHVKTKQRKVVLRMVKQLDEQANIFETYSTHKYGRFFIASTTPSYRKQGLIKELYKRTINYFKAEGLQMAVVFTSSPITEATTTSFGFRTLGRIHFKDLKDPETGKKLSNENELNSDDFMSLKICLL